MYIKNNFLILIFLVLVAVFYIIPADCQNVDSEQDTPDPNTSNHNEPNPDTPNPDIDRDTPDPNTSNLPSKRPSGSSSRQPRTDLDITVSSNRSEVQRGEYLELNFNITSMDARSSDIQLDIRIPQGLEHIKILSDENKNINNIKNNHIFITRSKLGKEESFNVSILFKVLINASIKTPIIINESSISSIRWTTKKDDLLVSNLSIIVHNNKPKIDYVELEILSTCIYQKDGILILSDPLNPYELKLNSSFNDIEDRDLLYTLEIEKSNIRISNYTDENPYKNSINLGELKADNYYSFKFSVNDSESSETIWPNKVDINYKNFRVNRIYIPEWKNTWIEFREYIIELALIFILIIVVFSFLIPKIFNFREYKIKNIYTIDIIYCAFLGSLISSYYLLYSYDSGYKITIFFKSLPFYILIIYIICFGSFVYLTERFFEILEEENQPKLLITNGIIMAILLWSIVFVIPRIDPISVEEHLRSYYATMSEIFATILAIVAAFFSGMPKNILNLSKSHRTDRLYPYPIMLHRFVIVYGSILALSFWGLSAGTYINFNPFVNLDPYNMMSIFIFFLTLTLIPPAITCLYELFRLIIFTSNIIIKSIPSGAQIIIIENDKEEIKTQLNTPNMIILKRSENIKISLAKDGYKKSKPFCPIILDGTQHEYLIKLEKETIIEKQ